MKLRSASRLPAFSLIEILIAVTVLALGLLGLGMVFPVVVRQQRTAQDSIQGLSAARSAAEYIRSRQGLAAAYLLVGDKWYGTGSTSGFPDGHSQSASDPTKRIYDGKWLIENASLPGVVFTTSRTTGDVAIGDSAQPAIVTIADRLTPAPFTSPTGPQFVWDTALRVSGPGTVQVALFARRIDAGIRIPSSTGKYQYNLSHVLTGEPKNEIPATALRVPVGEDNNRRPTLTGLDGRANRNYSLARVITPEPVDKNDPAELLRLSTQDATLLALARQPGQKLVDNSGIVHTVSRVSDTFTNGVMLERGLTQPQRDAIAAGTVQFLMTPQVPAAVTVVTLQK